MADVTCRGFEKKLSDCREGQLGAFVCVEDQTDAGVKCSCKLIHTKLATPVILVCASKLAMEIAIRSR